MPVELLDVEVVELIGGGGWCATPYTEGKGGRRRTHKRHQGSASLVKPRYYRSRCGAEANCEGAPGSNCDASTGGDSNGA